MKAAQLWMYFKDNGIPLEQVAEQTGYNLAYLLQLMLGYTPISDRAKFRFIKAYPELADALLAKEPA